MPSLFFVKDGEKTMANADISLLFGVLGEGSLSGESGSLIQSQLGQIMKSLNENPLKVKVGLDTEKGGQKSWSSQLQTKLDALSNSEKFSIKVSKLELGAGAVTDFKKQLNAVINTLNLDKGTSITLTAEGIGEIKKKMQEAGDDATEAARKVAEFKVQMEALGGLKTSVHTALNSLSKNAGSEERTQISALTAQYEQWAIKIEAVRASKNSVSDTYRAELEAEGTAIQESINAITQKLQALNISRDAYADATKAIKDYYSALTSLIKSDSDVTLNGAAWESESENYTELAEALNRTKTAYDQVIGAMSNMPLEQQASLKRLLTEQTNKYNLALEEQANKEHRAAQESESNSKSAIERNNLYKQTADAITRIAKAQRDWSAAATGSSSGEYSKFDGYIERLRGLQNEFDNLSNTEIKQILSGINKEFANSSGVIKDAGENTKSFTERVGTLAGKFSSWLTVSQVIMQVYQALKQMVTAVIEVDTAMTELRKVTDETEEAYSKFIDTAIRRSKELGSTISDTITASADFARLGFSLDEASALADAAIVYKNVGDGITDISMASESIISTMKAFGVAAEDAMFIVDKFNEVGNNFAISSKGVGDALLRSASALAAGNNTLDESIALITAANSTIQDADKVGTTLKTVSMFLRAAKTEAEEAGESTEGMANSVSELRAEILALTGNEVDIQIDENTFKSTYQIMKELSEVWDKLTDVSRANILEMIGGKRNSNVVMSLIENFEVAEEVIASAADAAGSALEENAKHLASIEGAISKFKATFEELSITLIDGEFVEDIVNIGTGLLNILNIVAKVVDALGGLKTVLIAVASAFLMAKNGALAFAVIETVMNLFKALHSGILNVVNIIPNAIAAWKAYATSAAGAAAANTALQASIPVIGLVLAAISALVAVISLFNRKSVEETDKSLKELKSEFKSLSDSISSTASEFRNLRSTAEEVIPRFTELAKGVNALGENAKLTDKEYAEFLSLNNQIAEMFPELNLGMDSNGNAMLTLSYTADTLADSLWNVVAAQREAANAAIADSMPDVLENVKGQVSEYKNLINDVEEETTFLLDMMEKKSKGSYDFGINTTSSDPNKIGKFSDEAYKYIDLLKKYGIEYEVKRAAPASKYVDVIIKDQEAAERALSQSREKLVNNYTNEMNNTWESLNSIAIAWAKTNPLYDELNEPMQNIAQYMIRGLNFGELGKTTEKEIQDYVQGSIITPLSNADKPIRDTFAKITDWQEMLSNGEIDNDTFADNVRGAFESLFDAMSPSYVDKFKAHFVDGMNQMGDAGDNFADALDYLIAEWGRVEQTVSSTQTAQNTISKFRGVIDVLKAASDEYRNMGSVSTDTYNDVIALGEDYADLFDFTNGKIELESETLGKFVDKLMQEYGAMLAANGATEDQIQLLYLYGTALSSANQETEVTLSSMKSLVDVLSSVKEGTSYSSIAMLELLEQYPELTGAVIETAEGYTIEEAAVKSLIAEKAKELKINESLIKSQARLNLIKGANNVKTADTVDAIFEEYGDSISSFEDYVTAWEQYFNKSAAGASWVDGLEEYVNATIAETERLAEINKLLEDLLSPDQYKFGTTTNNNRTEKTETEFDRQYKEHQHLLAMEQESVEDYLNWLTAAYQAAYDTNLIELDDYYKYQEEIYDKTKDLFDDYLNDNEHSIFLLENADAEASEIVKIYSGMMSAIEAQIQAYMNLGLDANSDYIQELQKQWYGYRDNILSVHEDALNADIGDYEHDIFMLEQHGGSADEIAAIYRKMQEAVHATAEEYRALGLEENDDYIQELQKQWWEYEENIAQLRQDEFDDYLNDSKFSVEQLKADGASASEISRSYSAILKAINDEIEYYTSKGFDITDEIVQNLIDEARNLEDEVISSLNEIVSEAQSAVDDLQNVYTTLSDAADEYAEYGYITIDSLQSIIDLGVEYMAFLQNENGQLVINKENIQNVIAARTEQLAVESALNYVEQLRLALEAGNTAELERLLYATNNATNATWGLVYANLALLNLEDSQYTAALNNINNLRALADNAIANIGASMSGTTQSRSDMLQAELDARKEALQDQKEALDDILDYTMELIEWEAEQQVEALEEQISDYEEIVELKKEMLEATKEEADYEDELADKIEEIAKIQERINALALDDSREAQAEKITLEEELADLQEELTDYQADHMLEVHENTLDDMADAYSAEKEKEIAAVEETVSSTEKVYQLAIERINNDWNGLYQDLLAYNYEYGNTLQQDLVSAWNAASMAVQEYGSYVQAVSSITAAINAAENTTITPASGTTNLGSVGNYNAEANASKQKVLQVSSLVDRMEANSAAWWNASESERDKLEDANVQIAAQIEALLGEKLVRGADGVWYLGSVGSSRKLYDCYHDGGIVGGLSTLKKNEAFAVLENGEMVLTDEQQASLFRLVDFATTLSDRFGKLIENVGYSQLFQRKGATTADELAAITEDKRVNIEFGDVYITGTNDETVEKHREVNRQFVNDVLKQLNIKR